jgi:beta-glucanase (GH16 family)
MSLALPVTSPAQTCTGVASSTTGAIAWTPQWCQEFNATTPAPPDTSVWGFDLGNSGFGNHEIETYCGPPGYSGNPSTCPSAFATATSNAYLDGNGHLVLQAISNDGGTTWTSARIKTQGLQDFQYGRIEASIQLPSTANQGLWPAFWSLGSDINTTPWPACGEADIMEVWSQSVLNGPGPGGNRSTLHTTATGGSGLQPNGSFAFPSGQANDSAFHTYGLIWSANMQQYYIDDPLHPYYIATPSDLPVGDTWPFNAKIFLIANIAVGGTLGGTPSSATANPGVMTFDYVRQYQPSAAVSTPVLGTPPSITVKAGAVTGNASTFTPTLTSGTGFVYFSCSTTAPKATCAITTTDPLNTHVINSSASAPESVTVSVTTAANVTASSSPVPAIFRDSTTPWLPISAAVFFASLLLTSSRLRSTSALLYLCTLLVVIPLCGAMSCGGGGSSTTVTPPGNNGTTPGNYTVSLYAFTETNSSNGANSNADATVSIPLTVN